MNMIKKFNEFIKESTEYGFDWTFIISLELIAGIYSGGEYFEDLKPSDKSNVKRLFKDIANNVKRDLAEIESYGIEVVFDMETITFNHVSETSLMYITQNIIEKWGLSEVNVLYVDDFFQIASEDVEDDLMGEPLWDTYQDYLYDNLEH